MILKLITLIVSLRTLIKAQAARITELEDIIAPARHDLNGVQSKQVVDNIVHRCQTTPPSCLSTLSAEVEGQAFAVASELNTDPDAPIVDDNWNVLAPSGVPEPIESLYTPEKVAEIEKEVEESGVAPIPMPITFPEAPAEWGTVVAPSDLADKPEPQAWTEKTLPYEKAADEARSAEVQLITPVEPSEQFRETIAISDALVAEAAKESSVDTVPPDASAPPATDSPADAGSSSDSGSSE